MKNSKAAAHKNSVEAEAEKHLDVGIIGCGYWGPKLARNVHEIPGAALSMATDIQESRLSEIKKQFPSIITTKNYSDLLEADLDAVIIATPVNMHYPITKDALQADKHVLVEKPITLDSSQAEELITIADERGLTLMVGHTFEYNPAVEAIRKVIKAGELGKIYYLNSTRVNLGPVRSDINVMWDLAPHDISIFLYILDEVPTKVRARGGIYLNPPMKLYDVVYINLLFDSGILANLRLSWLDPVKERKLTIVGNKKMLIYDDISKDKVVIYDKGVEVHPFSLTEEEFHTSYRHGEETALSIQWIEPLRSECEHFLGCVRSGDIPRSSGEVGLRNLKILEVAQQSLLNDGVELEIEY